MKGLYSCPFLLTVSLLTFFFHSLSANPAQLRRAPKNAPVFRQRVEPGTQSVGIKNYFELAPVYSLQKTNGGQFTALIGMNPYMNLSRRLRAEIHLGATLLRGEQIFGVIEYALAISYFIPSVSSRFVVNGGGQTWPSKTSPMVGGAYHYMLAPDGGMINSLFVGDQYIFYPNKPIHQFRLGITVVL